MLLMSVGRNPSTGAAATAARSRQGLQIRHVVGAVHPHQDQVSHCDNTLGRTLAGMLGGNEQVQPAGVVTDDDFVKVSGPITSAAPVRVPAVHRRCRGSPLYL